MLGFDADHCIVKYNVKNLMLHVLKIQALDMHLKGGYPLQITQIDLVTDLGLCLNNCVWDITRGNILKLTEGKIVSRAHHGKKLLTD